MTSHTLKYLQIDLNFCPKKLCFLILTAFFVMNVSAEQVLPSTVKKIKPSIVAVGQNGLL